MNGRSFFSALALVLALAATTFAQRNMIRGKVRTANGNAVNNAIVELRVNGSGMIGQTVTRNDGDFAFNGLSPGEYEIVVTSAGFEPVVQIEHFIGTDRMNSMEILQVEVILKPLPEPALGPPGTYFAQDVPKAARASYEKAVVKMREGKFEECIALLREAAANFNDYFDARVALARELFRSGKDNEALEELERARQINDRQDIVYHLFGLVMFKQQKFKLAQRAFHEATSLNANSAISHFYRGVALIELGTRESGAEREADFADAEKELGKALELSNKQMTDVYRQRARIHEWRGNKEAAARDLESYLKAEPKAKNAEAIRQEIAKLRDGKK